MSLFLFFFKTPVAWTVFYTVQTVVDFFLWHLLIQEEELSPEEQLAEKLRVKKLQEDADLELAKDAFGKKVF